MRPTHTTLGHGGTINNDRCNKYTLNTSRKREDAEASLFMKELLIYLCRGQDGFRPSCILNAVYSYGYYLVFSQISILSAKLQQDILQNWMIEKWREAMQYACACVQFLNQGKMHSKIGTFIFQNS